MSETKKICAVEAYAVYTGGNIWMFYGKVSDGNFSDGNFFLTDDNGATFILNKDPSEDLEEACYESWQNKYLVRELMGEERIEFCNTMFALLKTYRQGDPHRGGIVDTEIEQYIREINSDFQITYPQKEECSTPCQGEIMNEGLRVKDLKAILNDYDDNARVVVVDWSNGQTYEPSIGGDDDDEGVSYCRIGIG